jgi:hypothetical protein
LKSITWNANGTFMAQLRGILDSGESAGSQVWTRFAKDFPDLLKQRGKKGSMRVTEVGGSKERKTIALPEIQLEIGSLEAVLGPAQVLSKPVGDDFHHGLLGWMCSARLAKSE